MITTDRPSQTGAAVWVQQQPHLWTGRADGRPIGTIEQGRRFTFLTTDAVADGGHRSLAAAQAAACSRADAGVGAPVLSRTERLLAGAGALVGAGTVALSAVAAVVVR